MNTNKREVKIKLLSYQQELVKRALYTNIQYFGFIAGTGTGKTYLMPRLLYAMMNQNKGEEWIVSAPSIQMLKNNPINYTQKFFKEIGIDFDAAFNKSEMVYNSDLGKIYFISAETPDRMQGIHPAGIFGDEAGLYKISWWLTAVQRVSFKKGKILLFTTPYTLNWLKTEFYDQWKANDPAYFVINPRSIDNKYYPKESYYNAQKRLPEWKFKMLYEAQFSKPYGLIYPEYTTTKRFIIPDNWPRLAGGDHGYNDPFTIIKLAHDVDNDMYYVYEEFYKTGMLDDQIYDELVKEDIPYYIDPENKTMNESLRMKGINIRLPVKTIIDGVIAVNSLLKNKKLILFDDLIYTKDELNSYQWAIDKNEELLDKPKDSNNHLMDALRYVVNTAIVLKDNSTGKVSGSNDLDHTLIDQYCEDNSLKGY